MEKHSLIKITLLIITIVIFLLLLLIILMINGISLTSTMACPWKWNPPVSAPESFWPDHKSLNHLLIIIIVVLIIIIIIIILTITSIPGAVVNINFAEVVKRRIFFNFIAPHRSTRVETFPFNRLSLRENQYITVTISNNTITSTNLAWLLQDAFVKVTITNDSIKYCWCKKNLIITTNLTTTNQCSDERMRRSRATWCQWCKVGPGSLHIYADKHLHCCKLLHPM